MPDIDVPQGPSGEGQPQGTSTPTPTPTSWRDSLPDELKAEKSLESFKDVGSLAKSYVEAQKFMGQSIRLPSDTSKPEEWNQVYAKLGRPETPDKYDIKRPKSDLPWSDELEKTAREEFHKLGLNSSQAQGLVDLWHKNMEGMVGAAKASMDQGMEALKKEHGEKLPQVIESCQRMVDEFCTEEEIKMIEETGRGNEPWFINMMARAWGERGEDHAPSGDHGVDEGTKNEALMKIAQIRNDPKHPYHKGDAAAVDEMSRLYRVAAGTAVHSEAHLPEA